MQNKKFKKLLYWAEMFEREHKAKPNKLRAARLLFIHASFMTEFVDLFKTATEDEKKNLSSVVSYLPSTSELVALFIRVDADEIISSRSLATYSPDLRMNLINLRNEDSFLKTKERYLENLYKLIDFLKSL